MEFRTPPEKIEPYEHEVHGQTHTVRPKDNRGSPGRHIVNAQKRITRLHTHIYTFMYSYTGRERHTHTYWMTSRSNSFKRNTQSQIHRKLERRTQAHQLRHDGTSQNVLKIPRFKDLRRFARRNISQGEQAPPLHIAPERKRGRKKVNVNNTHLLPGFQHGEGGCVCRMPRLQNFLHFHAHSPHDIKGLQLCPCWRAYGQS